MYSLLSKFGRVVSNVVGDNSNEFVGEGRMGDRGSCSRVKGVGVGRIGEIGVGRSKEGLELVGAGVLIEKGWDRVRFRDSFIGAFKGLGIGVG